MFASQSLRCTVMRLAAPRWGRRKAEQGRAVLQKGTGILKTAWLTGTGVPTVQRIKREIWHDNGPRILVRHATV